MAKILYFLFVFLLGAPAVLAQVETGKLLTGIEENKSLNRLDSIAKSLNYKGGEVVAVFAQFTIDENGKVTKITAKGPHPAFEEEAIRIIKELPGMDPAMYNGKPIARRFSLPLKFKIETEREKKKRLKKERKKAEKD